MRHATMLVSALLIAACGQHADETHKAEQTAPAAANEPVTNPPAAESIYEAAVANESRPEADRGRDAGRKPAEVLEFLGIERGMTVLDMFSGGGYYTEIIASVVGDGGKVIAQSNEAYLQFVGEEFHTRYANDRLANVEILMAENNALELAPNSLDAIMLVLSYHDLVLEDAANGWPLIDVPALLAEFREGLKPGGVVAIIDHYAESGAPAETGNTLHRIDPAIVVADLEAAGFVLEAQSDMLRNPDDDLNKIVFDPELRGKTDRFVMRFRKTE